MTNWQTVWNNKKRFPLGFNEIPLFRGNTNLFFEKNVPSTKWVLDFGSGDKKLRAVLQPKHYVSVDIDSTTKPDYNEIVSVTGDFDAVVSRFVVEHLSVDEIRSFFENSFRLSPRLVFTTHNAWSNYGSFAGDYTHKTLLSFRALGGLLSEAGYQDIRFFRIADMGLIWLREPIAKLIRFDYCQELGCVAIK